MEVLVGRLGRLPNLQAQALGRKEKKMSDVETYPVFLKNRVAIRDDSLRSSTRWCIANANGSYILAGAHAESACMGRTCVLHNPTDHHMRNWYLLWRNDRGIFERVCPHGTGHPDPDQGDYWAENNQSWQWVHGCDGCCHQEKEAISHHKEKS